jgi:hypothetical protein
MIKCEICGSMQRVRHFWGLKLCIAHRCKARAVRIHQFQQMIFTPHGDRIISYGRLAKIEIFNEVLNSGRVQEN